MTNFLSQFGITLQGEISIWMFIGVLRTIFDATLFRVKVNLERIWQMKMPVVFSGPLQHAIKLIVTTIVLLQSFTVHIYLAAYVVLMYPLFLEDRPGLLLPWLLVSAVKNFLTQLLALAVGLGACIMMGPVRPACLVFVVRRLGSLLPAIYMWSIVFCYYKCLNRLTVLGPIVRVEDMEALDQAVRRRRTKSMFSEEVWRQQIVENIFDDQLTRPIVPRPIPLIRMTTVIEVSDDETQDEASATTQSSSWTDDFYMKRDADVVSEQIAEMILRIAAYRCPVPSSVTSYDSHFFPTSFHEDIETLTHVTSSGKTSTFNYLQVYPDIFGKRQDAQIKCNLGSVAMFLNDTQKKNDELGSDKVESVQNVESLVKCSLQSNSEDSIQTEFCGISADVLRLYLETLVADIKSAQSSPAESF